MHPTLPAPDIPKAVLNKFFGASEAADEPAPPGPLFRAEAAPGRPASALRVLGIAPDAGACGHYRVKYPLMCLAAQGARVEVRTSQAEVPLESFLAANVLYLSRASTDEFRRDVKAVARLTGATVVYDLDDALGHVAPTSPAFAVYDPDTPTGKATLDGVLRFLASADGAVFSTRELQAQYGDTGKSSHVIANGLDLDLGERDWDPDGPRFDWRSVAAGQGCPVDADSLLLGWAGSSTHHDSLRELGDAVARVLARTRNAYFGMFTNPYLACHFCVERWGLPLHRVVFLPPVPFREYPRVLSAFDVALAPLKNDVFNRCKSDLRLLEHGAWGTPYVASKVAPYYRLHRETGGAGGEIATNPAEFAAHAARLLGDHDARREKGAFLGRHVRDHCNVRRVTAALPYTLRAIQESRAAVLFQPSLRSLEDAWRGLPKAAPTLDADSPCPCGSGEAYGACPNGCPPAFGELSGAAGEGAAARAGEGAAAAPEPEDGGTRAPEDGGTRAPESEGRGE